MKILDTLSTVLFTIAVGGISLLVAGWVGYFCSLFICSLAELLLGWEISETLVTIVIALIILISFWGGLRTKKKKK